MSIDESIPTPMGLPTRKCSLSSFSGSQNQVVHAGHCGGRQVIAIATRQRDARLGAFN